MTTRVTDRVGEWTSRSFAGGYDELQRLADAEFSGAVRADDTELFMTKGVVVGVQHGSIEAFESSGTAYKAPSPALPLLAVMQARADTVRAKYYTKQTPLAEVDTALAEGGFTGFIVLSENVLSGDYYQVYHAGRSMSVAYVGEGERLVTGDEAFETAADEVGLYEVRPVDVTPVEIPATDPGPSTSSPEADDSAGAAPDTDATTTTTTATTADGDASGVLEDDDGMSQATASASAADGRGQDTNTDTSTNTEASRDTASEAVSQHDPAEPEPEPAAGPDAGGQSASAQSAPTGETAPDRTADSDEPRRQQPAGGRTQQTASPALDPEPELNSESDPESRTSTTEQRAEQPATIETLAVPSVDPERTVSTQESRSRRSHETDESSETGHPETETDAGANDDASASASGADQTAGADQADHHRETQPQQPQTADVERLKSELAAALSERDELRDQLETVTQEREKLVAEVERLEEKLAAETPSDAGPDHRLSPEDALSATDLFVRYDSRGEMTLEKAHNGAGRREEAVANLRLETHAQFEPGASVGGRDYETFLAETTQYQFAEWVIQDLLFEIRSTGNETALKTLYDVLHAIDRVEFAGTVSATATAEDDTTTEEAFDLVFRDRMGGPLLVTNLNDSLDAASEPMMEQLVTAAQRVGQSHEHFAGAFLVTTSFFEPGALEVASGATKSGFLSRDKRASFVNLSRKRGFHLCLVEARDQNFNLAVPEL